MASAHSSIPLASPPLLSPPPIAAAAITSSEGKQPQLKKKRVKRRSQRTSTSTSDTNTSEEGAHNNDNTPAAAADNATAATGGGAGVRGEQETTTGGESTGETQRETAEKEGEKETEGEAESSFHVTAPEAAAPEGEGEGEPEHEYLQSSSSSAALLSQQPEGQPSSSSTPVSRPTSLPVPPQLATPKHHPPATLRPAQPSSSPSSASSVAVPAAAAASLPDGQVWTRLSHLQLLLDQQLISQSEYERRKQQLVDELTGTKLTPTITPAPSLTKKSSSSSSSSASSLRKRSQPIQQEREIDSIPLTSPSPTNSSSTSPTSSQSSSQAAVRHFPTHQSNNHLLTSNHSFLPRPPPDFTHIPEEEAVLHTFDIDTSSWSRETVRVRVERESFARGSLRVAYHMSGLCEVEKRERKKVRAKEIEREKKRAHKLRKHHPNSPSPPASSSSDVVDCTAHTYVAKMSIDPYEERESYFQDVITQHYARAYAIRYNSYAPPKKIDIVLCWLLELKQRPGAPLCCVEVFVNGVYRKHNNNFGYVSDDERNTPQAFSHFSYEASQHSILVVDIQGVGDVWTDPQIHSRDGVGFGKGNMGERGVEKFIASHRCNAICRYLKLPNLGRERRGGGGGGGRRSNGSAVGVVDETREGCEMGEDGGGGEEEGTMPAAQYMSYQSVDVMQIEFRSDNLPDPFNGDSPLPQHRRTAGSGMMTSISALILPPLIGPGKGRDGSSAAPVGGGRRDMKSPLMLGKGKAGGMGGGGGGVSSSAESDTVTSTRCKWCCIL